MEIPLPSTWPERSLVFVQACLKDFKKLPPEEALSHCIIFAGKLAEAKLTVFLSTIDKYSSKVIASNEHALIGKSIKFSVHDPYSVSKIELKEKSQLFLSEEEIAASHFYLYIPIHEKSFSGTLVFGYGKKPKNLDGLTEFAGLVQGICQERICLKRSIDSLEKSRIRFETLQQYQANLEALLENTEDFIWSLDNNLLVTTINPSFQKKVFQQTGQLIRLGNLFDLNIFPKEVIPQWQGYFDRAFLGERFTEEIKIKVLELEYIYEYSFVPIKDAAKNIVGIAIFGKDVSHRIKTEQEIKKAKESAERANQAKNYFLANMSHDLRTPIHTILGFAQVLKDHIKSFESLNYLEYIISSAELLYKLVDDILQLTKIEEGKLELKEEPFLFKEVLLSNLYPYQFQANEKGLYFHLSFDEPLPQYCLGDAAKISRIIINLIGNSLKFTSKGFIHVSFTCLNPSSKEEIKQIKISVTDTGIGISKEKHDLIFNSFTQAEPSINRKFGGSGLGLAIVKELVQLMGGKCGVESPINDNATHGGMGSAFWFVIPLKETYPTSQPKGLEQLPEEINYQGKLNVLVVEDNVINQQLVYVMLSKLGCIVAMADNGKEAIDKIRSNPFDLILMDVQMSVLNGIEATRIIRKKISSEIPIIGLSANIYKEDIEKCLESGMNDYLEKPFSEKDLQEKIFKWAGTDHQNNSSPPQPFNRGMLTDLSFLLDLYNGDIKAVKGMVEDFFKFQNQLIEQMEEKLTSHDYKKIATLAHNMRSSLRTIGLSSLYDPLIFLEKATNAGDDHLKMVEMFDEIKYISQQASQELRASFI